jgi:hypothetical protein
VANKRALLDGRKHESYYAGRSTIRSDGRYLASWYSGLEDLKHKLFVWYKPVTIWNLETGEATAFDENQDVPESESFVKPISRTRLDQFVDRPVAQEVLDRFQDRIPETARGTDQTADGRRLIVYLKDGGMAVWGIESGEPIYRCYQFHNGSRWLTVTPDGTSYGNLEFVRYRRSR